MVSPLAMSSGVTVGAAPVVVSCAAMGLTPAPASASSRPRRVRLVIRAPRGLRWAPNDENTAGWGVVKSGRDTQRLIRPLGARPVLGPEDPGVVRAPRVP